MESPNAPAPIPILLLAPFCALLAAIALGPLCFHHWWRRHYPKVSCGLAAAVAAAYAFGLREPGRVGEAAHDYLSFMALVGSLFVVSGGIHITVKGEATPLANVVFLLVGALAANVVGTTGASILLIRPWLRLNKWRAAAHHVVFFIFIVSNVGGCLTPLGPPLFLGYLMGVPFWWTAAHCWPMWCAGMALLLAAFFMIDTRSARRAASAEKRAHESWRFEGLGNLVFLAIILAAAIFNGPPFVREAVMIAAAAGSWFTTPKAVHESNEYDWEPLREVAFLFIGIFGTMLPALDWLQGNAAAFAKAAPGVFYFGSGGLSSILDNAPTYLCFLQAAVAGFVDPAAVARLRAASPGLSAAHAQVAVLLGDPKLAVYVAAVSVGSVFFGGATYIGNGPNFMVKAIAEHQKAPAPGFLDYIVKYTLPFMAPALIVVWLLFFRG